MGHIDTGLSLATEGEGGRELPIGSVYKTELVESEEGIKEIDLMVTPAVVDYSKVVPYLVSVVDYLINEVNELKKDK